MMLPPCVKRMLSEFKPEYAPIIAGYFKSQNAQYKIIISAVSNYGPDVLISVLDAYRSNSAVFSCNLVQNQYPGLCDTKMCPLVNNLDPVEMAKSLVEKAIYVSDTGEMIIFFKGTEERLIFDFSRAIRSTRWFAAEFYSKTLLILGEGIRLFPYKDEDLGTTVDPAFEFLEWLGKNAEKVIGQDVYGIGSVINYILESEPILTEPEARHNPDAHVLIKRMNGKYHLLIEMNYLRLRLRPVVGHSNATPQKMNMLLAQYGIRTVRVQVGGARKYFYAIPPEVLLKLTGRAIEELGGIQDFDEALNRILQEGDNE